jgi:hypothetical protein
MSGLPTNSGLAKDQGCNPVSSNCVVWQGPDLECIGLCRGDTISDVIAKLATQLCTLVDMFDLSEFDFTCLAVPVSEQPTDAGGLIQILIDRICALENISPIDPANPTGDCPDNCIVPIADCFYFIDPQGDTVTTMTLTDYVNAIGNRICDILSDITVLQNAVDTLNQQVNGDGSGPVVTDPGGLTGEVGAIKTDYTPRTALDYQVNSQTDPSAGVQFITEALRSVEDYSLRIGNGTGSQTLMYQNILKAGLISNENKMFGTGQMNSITGWINDPETLAESLGNAHLAIADLRDQVEYMKENCCSTGCSDIWLNFRAELSGTILTLFTDGSTGFTSDWKECTGQSLVTVTDTLGNSSTITTSLIALISNPAGYTFDLAPTSIDATLDLTVVADTCFINTETDTTCNTDYTDTIYNAATCPAVVLTVFSTSVNYQFNTTSGFTFIANVYYDGGSSPVATQIIADPGVIVIQSIFGLLADTAYQFELVVVDGEGGETPCPKQSFTTLVADCQPPINAVAILTT